MADKLTPKEWVTRRVLEQLIDEFDADILIHYAEPLPYDNKNRVFRRLRVEDQIREQFGENACVPAWSPYKLSREGRVVVLGPQPVQTDLKMLEFGHSRASQIVRAELKSRDIPAVMQTDLCRVFTDVGDRAPTANELAVALPLVLDALDAADVRFVVLHGAHAVHAWRPDLTMDQTVGRIGLWRNRWWIVPIWHASAVHRQQGLPKGDWARQLDAFAALVQAPDPFALLSRHCISKNCGHHAYAWDPDGMPWCREHYMQGIVGKRKADDRTRKAHKAAEMAGQYAMDFDGGDGDTREDTREGEVGDNE